MAARREQLPAGTEMMTRPAVRCPRCKLVIVPRMQALVPRHCPRCLARRRLAVEFEQVPARPSMANIRAVIDAAAGLAGR